VKQNYSEHFRGAWSRAVSWKSKTTVSVINPFTHDHDEPDLVHAAPVTSASVSAAGRLATVTADGTLTIWDSTAGRALVRTEKLPLPAREVIISPDGSRCVLLTTSGTVEVRNAADGSVAGGLPVEALPVRRVLISPDSRKVAVLDADRRISIWNSGDADRVAGPFGPADGARALRWSPDGAKLAVQPAGGREVQMWDAATGRPMGVELRHTFDIQAFAFSPDGRWIATGGADELAQLWDVGTGRAAGPALRHRAAVNALAFSPDSQLLATAAGDGVGIWMVPDGERAGPFMQPMPGKPVTGLGFSETGQSVLCQGGAENSRFPILGLWRNSLTADLAARITLTSGFRLDSAGSLRAVPAEELVRLWQDLQEL
jgi:WD40 repeat protein